MAIRKILFFVMVCAVVAGAAIAPAQAQKPGEPPMPKPLKTMADEGAQIRYIGSELGLNGWLAIHKGQEQYFYATPAGDAMILGLLFETETGRLVTMDQIRKVQEESGGVLDMFSQPAREEKPAATAVQDLTIKSPAEKMFEDIEATNQVAFGDEKAPVIYAFMDPQCPHCHSFMQDLRGNYLSNGVVQLRMIPVGFNKDTLAQAAFLLGAPDAADRFLRHLDGDKMALPVSHDINQQGVERNMSVMQGWKLNVTPLIVYRSAKGEVKIIQGRPKDLSEMIRDLPAKQ